MGFVGQRDSKDLKNLVDASFKFHIVLHYCHKAISDYGTIYLDAHCVLTYLSPSYFLTMRRNLNWSMNWTNWAKTYLSLFITV